MAATKPLIVLAGEPSQPDIDTFRLWLNGYEVREAAVLREESEPPITREFSDYKQLLLSDTKDQFRIFQLLQPYLLLPQTLMNQHLFQFSQPVKRALIVEYYKFDEKVVREFLGKKLSAKNRKDLDNISDKTGVSLKSCKRQFDNIKQVLRVVDDHEGSVVENIKVHFILPEEMARSYASVVFISANRFETNKKKLSSFSFSHLTLCASEMIDHWTAGSEGSPAVDDDLELDRDFLQDLHDLKLSMLAKIWVDRHLKLIVKDLRKKKTVPALIKSVEQNFSMLSKSLILIGASLVHSKDLKDFFVDLVEDVILPCKTVNWQVQEVELILTSFGSTFLECEQGHSRQTGRPGKHEKSWSITYNRYLNTLKKCILILYHS